MLFYVHSNNDGYYQGSHREGLGVEIGGSGGTMGQESKSQCAMLWGPFLALILYLAWQGVLRWKTLLLS